MSWGWGYGRLGWPRRPPLLLASKGCIDMMSMDMKSCFALCQQVTDNFRQAGGHVYEFAAAEGVCVHPNGVYLEGPQARTNSADDGASNGKAK